MSDFVGAINVLAIYGLPEPLIDSIGLGQPMERVPQFGKSTGADLRAIASIAAALLPGEGSADLLATMGWKAAWVWQLQEEGPKVEFRSTWDARTQLLTEEQRVEVLQFIRERKMRLRYAYLNGSKISVGLVGTKNSATKLHARLGQYAGELCLLKVAPATPGT